MTNRTPREEAIGQAPAFVDFQTRLSRAAKVNRPILIIGERGSGKELAASRLHFLSPRWDAPFVALNCSALNPNLIETELFGHEAGAFTGAERQRKGRFEEAHRGTLFLDEIGLIPLEVQEKILRVVEYGEYERVGSSRTIEADVRIIGATNTDLPALCDKGVFKADLLDRLSFEVLFLPPLRHRREDLLLLARHFAGRMAREIGITRVPVFSPRAEEQILTHPWPGNIRELKNTVERAVYQSPEGFIETLTLDPFRNPFAGDGGPLGAASQAGSIGALPSVPAAPPADPKADGNLPKEAREPLPDLGRFEEARAAFEAQYVTRALEQSRYNQKQAAALLNLTYDQFRGLYRKYISPEGKSE